MNSFTRNKFLLLLLSTIFLFSCSQHEEIPVWEITKNDSPPSYLVGTIDYLDKQENSELINSFITEKFNESRSYITQIDLEKSDFIITKQWIEIGMNKTLKEMLSEKDFNTLKGLYSEYKGTRKTSIPAPDSVKMRLLFYLQDLIYSNNQDNFYFDQFWMKQAMASKKNLVGMETYQDFYKSLSETSVEEQINFMNSINNIVNFKDSLKEKISNAYYSGDYEIIHDIKTTVNTYIKSNYNNLYTNKHEQWINNINSDLQKGNTFISMDISHLYGKSNFIETLLSKGYKVEKVQ